MFRKPALKAVTLTAVSLAVAALAVGSASAGGYGNSYSNTYQWSPGHVGTQAPRPFIHIADHIWKRHIDWCYDRFRTYDAYNNTYQPYNGPRQQCWSPYISG